MAAGKAAPPGSGGGKAAAAAAEPAPVIIVRRAAEHHDHGHHGGAWKIAYADFVTAMMAFFMLLWILGATTEQQRKGIADYFTPTLVKLTDSGAGSNGVLKGRTIRAEDGAAPATASMGRGVVPQVVPRDLGIGSQQAPGDQRDPTRSAALAADREAFRRVEQALTQRLAADPSLAELREQVRFVQTREGLRIEIIDRAGFSMFELASDQLVPRAARLMAEVARSIDGLPNPIAVRGHTDSLRYADPTMNNWKLSAYRAEATRAAFARAGIPESRFARIEGVADTEPYATKDPTDPRNRRITVTLFYRGS
jgi:chemotaxis protein MotB